MFNTNINNFNLNLFRRIIIGGIIGPHGITSIFRKNLPEIIVFHIYLIICVFFDYILPLNIKLLILSILSIYHISFDIGIIKSILLHIITIDILNERLGFDIFLTYMVLIHTPLHYYNEIKSKKEFMIVIIFSIICLLLSLNKNIFMWMANKLPINGIIWTHIMFDKRLIF